MDVECPPAQAPHPNGTVARESCELGGIGRRIDLSWIAQKESAMSEARKISQPNSQPLRNEALGIENVLVKHEGVAGDAEQNPEVTILMPCLNESETLGICIRKAQAFLETNRVRGEVVVSDNGSTDGSQEIARKCGARVVDVPTRGYGAALIYGSRAARGKGSLI